MGDKKYYEKNRVEILQQKKIYGVLNKEKIAAKNKIRFSASPKAVKVGEKFHELTVINQEENEKSISSAGKQSSRKMWNVRCSCGNEFITSGTKLRRADVVMCKPCACKLRPQSAIEYTGAEILFKRVILNRAKKAGIPVSLSVDEFVVLATSNCHYCGAEPTERRYHGRRDVPIKINGIDRIDSAKGYLKDNCLPCCTVCNVMKASLGYDSFLSHIAQINQYRGTNNVTK